MVRDFSAIGYVIGRRVHMASGVRNVARQYAAFDDVDIMQPHRVTWRLRLDEDPSAFESSFTALNDRVHFFGRNAPRLEAGTDASSSWSFFATGGVHAPGVGAGRTFWVFDNLTGDSAFILNQIPNPVCRQVGHLDFKAVAARSKRGKGQSVGRHDHMSDVLAVQPHTRAVTHNAQVQQPRAFSRRRLEGCSEYRRAGEPFGLRVAIARPGLESCGLVAPGQRGAALDKLDLPWARKGE